MFTGEILYDLYKEHVSTTILLSWDLINDQHTRDGWEDMAAKVNLIVGNPKTYIKAKPLQSTVVKLTPRDHNKPTEASIRRKQLRTGEVHYLDCFIKKDPPREG